jgi:hypothetical protein
MEVWMKEWRKFEKIDRWNEGKDKGRRRRVGLPKRKNTFSGVIKENPIKILSAQSVCRPSFEYMIGLLRKRRNAKQYIATYVTLHLHISRTCVQMEEYYEKTPSL